MTTDTIGCRGFRADVAPPYMARNSLSFKLTSQDFLRVRGVLNIFEFWVRFIGHPHTLSPYSRLRSFTLCAHTIICQITRLYVSSIFPLQVKFTKGRLSYWHSYGLTDLSHIPDLRILP